MNSDDHFRQQEIWTTVVLVGLAAVAIWMSSH